MAGNEVYLWDRNWDYRQIEWWSTEHGTQKDFSANLLTFLTD